MDPLPPSTTAPFSLQKLRDLVFGRGKEFSGPGTCGTIRGEEVLLKGEDGVNVYTLRSEAVKASPCTRLPDAGARLSPPSRMLHYPVYVFVHECAYVRACVCRGRRGHRRLN